MVQQDDNRCPICGAPSAYVEPEYVDIGVGLQQVTPDGWECPIHGGWCYVGEKLVVQYPDATLERASEPSYGLGYMQNRGAS